MTTSPSSPKTVRAVTRALDLLDILSESLDGMTLSSLCKAADLNSSTAHRILSTLTKRGYVRQDATTKQYFLGSQSLHVGQAALAQFDLGKIAIAHMRELSAEVSELVNLAMLQDTHAVYIAQAPAERRSVQMFTQLGARVPLYCTGVGKAMLAYITEEHLDRLLQTEPLKAHTVNTITNELKLKEELQIIRQHGYAVDNEEREVGVRCIAASIFDSTGRVLAAVSISGPPARIGPEQEEIFIALVRHTALEISHLLGYRATPYDFSQGKGS